MHLVSVNVSAPAVPVGPHVAEHEAPRFVHTDEQPVKNTLTQSLRNEPPGARHAPPVHVLVPEHVAQASPPVPHAVALLPGRQLLPLQHPVHPDDVSQTHAPPEHRWPVPHAPVVHVPPQPSLPPHDAPEQLGVQPLHVPPEQVPVEHVAHTAPSRPHAPPVVPARQLLPLQHPLHEVGSQTQTPASQCWPEPHAPVMHCPPHPSLAPHVLPPHCGTHSPLPQRFGPAAPHVSPTGHAPQSTGLPQRPTSGPQ